MILVRPNGIKHIEITEKQDKQKTEKYHSTQKNSNLCDAPQWRISVHGDRSMISLKKIEYGFRNSHLSDPYLNPQ